MNKLHPIKIDAACNNFSKLECGLPVKKSCTCLL